LFQGIIWIDVSRKVQKRICGWHVNQHQLAGGEPLAELGASLLNGFLRRRGSGPKFRDSDDLRGEVAWRFRPNSDPVPNRSVVTFARS
jgi:hypothetical protein